VTTTGPAWTRRDASNTAGMVGTIEGSGSLGEQTPAQKKREESKFFPCQYQNMPTLRTREIDLITPCRGSAVLELLCVGKRYF
jgi:hypothetical protein